MGRKAAISKVIDGLLAYSIAILTALFAIIGFAFINFEQISNTRMLFIALVFIALSVILCVLLKAYLKYIKKLEDLK